MTCLSELYLSEPCESCVILKNCNNCIYCLEVQKEIHRRIKKEAVDRVRAIMDGTIFKWILTFTSPPGRPYEEFYSSIMRLKEKKWLTKCEIGYELHQNGAPHCHAYLETSKRIQFNQLKQINSGYRTQLKVCKGLTEVKWKQYLSKKKTQAEIDYFFHNEKPLCDITCVDQLK